MNKVTILKIIVSLNLILLLSAKYSYAADFTISHQFNPGEILSADVMNDVFSKIREANRTVTEATIIGEWNCNSYVKGAQLANPHQPEWTVDSQNLVGTLENSTLTFSNDGDGTYSMISSSPNLFAYSLASITDTGYLIRSNLLFFSYRTDDQLIYQIQMVGDTRLTLTPISYDTMATVVCDKTDIPPSVPSDLSASLSGTTVTLTWSDNSDDETSFNLYRKDSLTDEFTQASTVSPNTNSFSESLTPGTYWYRVSAVNANGESLGSNVVKVEVE